MDRYIADIIDRRIDMGLERLRKDYEVSEVRMEVPSEFPVAGRRHVVRQYEIKGVGNLITMKCPDDGPMQMNTFTLTPYFKNLPLITSDYMYMGEKRAVLNEIYSLVVYEDELYKGFIERFAAESERFKDYPDMKLSERWYDSLRPVYQGKNGEKKDDEAFLGLFMNNLEIFIEMEKALPLLDDGQRKLKWQKNYEYAKNLVEAGGASTNLFTRALGEDGVKKFFYGSFFGPDRYME